jgi:glutamate-ammonia-ligase adenylyltransferase
VPERTGVPTLARLGLVAASAQEDVARLGWADGANPGLLWALSRAANPDCALRVLSRLADALDEEALAGSPSPTGCAGSPSPTGWEELSRELAQDSTLRGRLLGVLGVSPALGDHLIANPSRWRLLRRSDGAVSDSSTRRKPEPLPTGQELAEELFAVLDAHTDERLLQTRLRGVYRDWQLRLAARDVAATVEDEPVLPLMTVAEHLSDMADAALAALLAFAKRKIVPPHEAAPRIAVIAMGKHGARELNYVSDVDVIFVAEPAGQVSDRIAAELMRACSYVSFVVDAGLRPEGRHGALTRTLESHLKYYTNWAKPWEFQALLKARPAVGDMALGQAWSDALNPMVWKVAEHEDFVDEVRAMRRRVEESLPPPLREREIKLGRGSLRDVEFAVQLLQLVHGGSDPNLRLRATIPALAALAAGGYVSRDDAANLTASYEFLRLLEHRLQMKQMQRTHTLPEDSDEEAMRWLARAAHLRPDGQHDALGVLRECVRRERRRVLRLHSKFFYQPLLDAVSHRAQLGLSEQGAVRQLRALGYARPEAAFRHLKALTTGHRRANQIQGVLLPTLLEWLGETPDPDGGLLSYRKISEAFADHPWYLRTLRDETAAAKRLMRVLGVSAFVPELMLRAPEVLRLYADGPGGPRLLSTNTDQVTSALLASSAKHKDLHAAVSAARGARRYELARVASADILGIMELPSVCWALSRVWAAAINAALAAAVRATTPAGEQPPAQIAVIGMGRLGGGELGYGSDADVLFVCEPRAGAEEHDAIKWATGVAERIRSLLAAPSPDPSLHVDVDLRPEGRGGPLVSTLAAYDRYYKTRAQTWEAQALLRAHQIAGDQELGVKFLHLVDPVRYPPGGIDSEAVREIRRIKARVDTERLPRGADPTTHTKLGRGGLADVEWAVQLIQLRHAGAVPSLHNTSTMQTLAAIEAEGLLPAEDVAQLREAWVTATKARNALVLVKGKSADQLPGPGPVLAAVAYAAGWAEWEDSGAFLDNYLRVTRRAHKVVVRVFEGETA